MHAMGVLGVHSHVLFSPVPCPLHAYPGIYAPPSIAGMHFQHAVAACRREVSDDDDAF